MRLSEDKITRSNAVEVKAAVLRAAQAGDAELDFSAVKTVDSTSVSILLSWVRSIKAQQLHPQIRGVPEKMRSLIKLYGVSEMFAPYVVD